MVRAASRDEDALFTVLLKMPGLNAILYLQLLQMLTAQVEGLQQERNLKASLLTVDCSESMTEQVVKEQLLWT